MESYHPVASSEREFRVMREMMSLGGLLSCFWTH